MAGDFDDVNSPEFQEAVNNAVRHAKASAQTYGRINKLKGLYKRTGALAHLLIENPDEYKKLKEEYPDAFDYLSAEGAVQAAKHTYEEIRKKHPGQTPEDKLARLRSANALSEDDKTDSQQAELVQALGKVNGDEVDPEIAKRAYDDYMKGWQKDKPDVRERRIKDLGILKVQNPEVFAALRNYVKSNGNETHLLYKGEQWADKIEARLKETGRKPNRHTEYMPPQSKASKTDVAQDREQVSHGKTTQEEKPTDNTKSDEKPEKARKSKENTGASATASEPAKTDEGGNREHSDGHHDGNQGFIYISDNMEHALKMGPTVLKEYMEQELGVEFPRDIIRHNADGGEYIPTRLLRKWFEENYLTSEQTDKIYALVDDRAAFDAKVREINDRDNYVAPTPQNEQSAEQAATAEKPEAAPKGCSLKMENDGTAIWTVSGLEENADSPLKNGTYTFYKNEKGMYIQYVSPDVSESPKYGPMTAEEMAEHPIVKALEKEAAAATNKQYQFKYWQPMTEDEKRAYDAEKADREYAAYISALKPEEIEKEKAELTQKAKQGDKDAEHKLAVLEQEVQQQKKAQEAQKRQEDIEKMRELLRNNPKKFEDVKNAYKAAMKDDAVKEQAAYYLGVIDEVEKDEATKEKVRQEKERSLKKLEKEIKRLEKQAKKMKEKGEKAKAEQLEAQAKEKRATLEQMRNDRAKARATDGARTDAAPHADRTATQTRAVEQQILDARRRSGNSMA